jgi:pimeloyl-ACP methyl ester carboxylesterase
MASPTPKVRKKSSGALDPSSRRPVKSADTFEPVDPLWLVEAFGVIVLASLVCGYLSLCLLFYQGQWQLVLHPSRSTPAPSAIGGAPIQIIHFGVDESATPQLAGWWVPAEPLAHYAAYTVLYLPSGDGSLSDNLPELAAIHALGLNLFAFDYRGYGESANTRPNQQRMTQDAASAWQYLTVSRALPPNKLVLFGNGVGCFLAALLAVQHPKVPAVVLDSPRPDLLEVVLADPRVKSLPVRSLFHERFDISRAATAIAAPKLFLISDFPAQSQGIQPARPTAHQLQALVDAAPSPKMIAHLKPSDRGGPVYSDQLSRFLDQYLR